MNIIKIRLNPSCKATCLRLLVFISAAVLASTGIVNGQNGKLRPEETALKNLHWRDIGPAIMGGRIDDFAVVDGNGSLRASRGVQSAGHSIDGSGNPQKGTYRVAFDRDVSRCAATVTAEPSYSGQITASINGTFRGIPNPNPDFQPNVFLIVLFDEDHNLVDSRFNVVVTC